MAPPTPPKRPLDSESEDEDGEDNLNLLGEWPQIQSQSTGKVEQWHEEEAVEFFRNHPAYYAKKNPRYMDTAYKLRLLHAKAVKMDVEPITLSKWFNNMRTRWVKLNKKSGDGAAQEAFTPREQWILNSFSFLQQHVIPAKPRQSKVGKLSQHQHLYSSLTPPDDAASPPLPMDGIPLVNTLPCKGTSSTTVATTAPTTTTVATANAAAISQMELVSCMRESLVLTRQIADKMTQQVLPQTKDQRLKSLLDTIEHGMGNYTEAEFLALQKVVWDKLHEFQMARLMASQQQHQRPIPSFRQSPPQPYQSPVERQAYPPSNEQLQLQIQELQAQLAEQRRIQDPAVPSTLNYNGSNLLDNLQEACPFPVKVEQDIGLHTPQASTPRATQTGDTPATPNKGFQ